MTRFFMFFAFLITISGIEQVNAHRDNSLFASSLNDSIPGVDEEYELSSGQVAGLEQEIKTIKDELSKHRTREDFFDNILNEQTTRFSLIVVGILALIGLATFVSFKSEVSSAKRHFNKMIEKQKEEFEEIKEDIHDIEKDMLYSSGDIAHLIAEHYVTQNDPEGSFRYYLISATYHNRGTSKEKDLKGDEPPFNMCSSILKESITQFGQLSQDPAYKSDINDEKDHYFNYLKELTTSKKMSK